MVMIYIPGLANCAKHVAAQRERQSRPIKDRRPVDADKGPAKTTKLHF